MDPVTTAAVVTAIIGAVGTVLAAWIQARAQRPAKVGDRRTSSTDEPVSAAGASTTGGEELQSDDHG
jgi:hypothetical protein